MIIHTFTHAQTHSNLHTHGFCSVQWNKGMMKTKVTREILLFCNEEEDEVFQCSENQI